MKVYDCLYLKGRPSGTLPGLAPMLQSDRAFFARLYSNGQDTGARDFTKIDLAEAASWAKTATGPVVIDIESRSDPARRDIMTDVRQIDVDGPSVHNDAEYILSVLKAAKSATNQPVGLYDLLPSGFNTYNSCLSSDAAELARASASNDFFASFVMPNIDVLCPSLYAPYNTPANWFKWAAWTASECFRLAPDKPKIAFLKPTIAGSLAPIDFWIFQLKACRDLGFDGVAAWASSSIDFLEAGAHIVACQEFVKNPQTDTTSVKDLKAAIRP